MDAIRYKIYFRIEEICPTHRVLTVYFLWHEFSNFTLRNYMSIGKEMFFLWRKDTDSCKLILVVVIWGR